MVKIVIPYLVIGGEKVEVPIGLSELLEPAWSKDVNNDATNEIVNKYNCTDYKKEDGRWATKFELKRD